MEGLSFLAGLKELAPATASVIGTLYVCYYLAQMIRNFMERHLVLLDRHSQALESHNIAITGMTTELRATKETTAKHTDVLRSVERNLDVNTRTTQEVVRRLEILGRP